MDAGQASRTVPAGRRQRAGVVDAALVVGPAIAIALLGTACSSVGPVGGQESSSAIAGSTTGTRHGVGPPVTVTTATPNRAATLSALACSSPAMLPVLRAALPLKPPDRIIGAQVLQCRNGYARVLAIASNLRCGQLGGPCHNNEQVFLKAAGVNWSLLIDGSGTRCDQLPPAEIIEACRALGLG